MNPNGGDSDPPPGGDAKEEGIEALRDQEQETSPDFVERVRGKIYRRATVSQFASYSWHLPKMILTELAGLLAHVFSAIGTKKKEP
ncbi:MAG: hypothetical protein ABI165_20550 [Bryobacteraceae bacterium]